MDSAFEHFLETLQQSGYSLTKVRKMVFRALMTEEPLTMRQLIAKLDSQVDRASVYRAIALFEQLSIIVRLQIGWKYKLELSEDYSTHHHHITCINCGETSPIVEDEFIETNINELAERAGFRPSSHQLEIRGLCPTCRGFAQPAVLHK